MRTVCGTMYTSVRCGVFIFYILTASSCRTKVLFNGSCRGTNPMESGHSVFIDYMVWKLIVLCVLAFIGGFMGWLK